MVTLSDAQLIDDVIGTLKHHGWNVDRKSLPMVLPVIMTKLKAHNAVAECMTRYLHDPELLFIDMAAKRNG
ncbi:hypothetical protein SAMN05216522_11738 [Rosenbergiella nectarea]|uniref:Uncharacterized protein n=1 Tax=Rosenbergiella nectarea TaxID=988801 RepID=A0A1H9MQF9_9GAMM|nr:hypothetical protein [Rosenbergiella nectarea]SER25922.1 hypothetical protein SAMN05216522_11738 [Rosenbergiella nectarea]